MYDTARQEQIYTEFYPKVAAYITHRVSHRSDAEDLVSTVFLKVFKNLPGFDETKASLSTWIFTVTRNTVIDHFRKAPGPYLLTEWEAAPDNVEETVLQEEMLDTLAAALEQLEERQRDIVILHYYQERTLTDIAAALGISYSYVKVLHKKAMEALKAVLG